MRRGSRGPFQMEPINQGIATHIVHFELHPSLSYQFPTARQKKMGGGEIAVREKEKIIPFPPLSQHSYTIIGEDQSSLPFASCGLSLPVCACAMVKPTEAPDIGEEAGKRRCIPPAAAEA